MPAFDLAKRTARLRRFDIVGDHSETSPRFVKHVALVNADDCDVSSGDTLDVAHMRPPLQTNGNLNAHVAGSIPLTPDEIKGIELWIATVEDEYLAEKARTPEQYVIDPPWDDIRNKDTGVLRYWRFSCAGFVLFAHLQVEITLLVIDKQALPEVTWQTLEAAYPREIRHPDLRERLGLPGNGPWRVLLAGYVLHAMNRSSDKIRAEPYLAQAGDERF